MTRKLLLKIQGKHDEGTFGLQATLRKFTHPKFLEELKVYSFPSKIALRNRIVQLSLLYDKIRIKGDIPQSEPGAISSLLGNEVFEFWKKDDIWQTLLDTSILVDNSLPEENEAGKRAGKIANELSQVVVERIPNSEIWRAQMSAIASLQRWLSNNSGRTYGADMNKVGEEIFIFDNFKKSYLERQRDELRSFFYWKLFHAYLNIDYSSYTTVFIDVRKDLLSKYRIEEETSKNQGVKENWQAIIHEYMQSNIGTTEPSEPPEIGSIRIFFDEVFPEFLPRNPDELIWIRNQPELKEFREMLSNARKSKFIYDRKLTVAVKRTMEELRRKESDMLRYVNFGSGLIGFAAGLAEPITGLLVGYGLNSIGTKLVKLNRDSDYKWAYMLQESIGKKSLKEKIKKLISL
jgi:hypothetical protein